jgi:cytochrome c oxidase subunit I
MSSEPMLLSQTESAPHSLTEKIRAWLTTVDHRRLGVLYILFALVFLIVAGTEATIMRVQLIRPNNDFVSPQVFNRMFTMYGTTMIFFVAMPLVFGFANYLIPLMIGARDMAFPRLNAFSFWIMALGALLLYWSCLGGRGFFAMGNAPIKIFNWFATMWGGKLQFKTPMLFCTAFLFQFRG